MKKRLTAYEIALSAVSCAFATMFLSLGVLNNFLLATGYIVACFCMMLPLSRGFWQGGLLSYLATILLVFLLGGLSVPWRVLPFALIFGLHPIVNHAQLRLRINVWVALAVKTVWFTASLLLTAYVWFELIGLSVNLPILGDYLYPALAVFGVAGFWLYDRLIFGCQLSVDRLVYRIVKK